jgi:hypothetical protein
MRAQKPSAVEVKPGAQLAAGGTNDAHTQHSAGERIINHGSQIAHARTHNGHQHQAHANLQLQHLNKQAAHRIMRIECAGHRQS